MGQQHMPWFHAASGAHVPYLGLGTFLGAALVLPRVLPFSWDLPGSPSDSAGEGQGTGHCSSSSS